MRDIEAGETQQFFDTDEQVGIQVTKTGAVGYLTVVLLIVTLFMAMATVAIAVVNPQSGNTKVLSLGEVKPTSDVPLFLLTETPDARYLRGAVGTSYDGTNWQLEATDGVGVEMVIDASREKLALYPTERVHAYSDYDESILIDLSTINNLQYLEIHDNTSDRVKALALEITGGHDTAFEKAEAIEYYLQNNYDYNLDFTPIPSDRESNDWFLFESGEGICGNFASAFVVLARESGLPARLAAGYFVTMGEEEQLVYEDQAHAWVEVGFEDLGWLVFDAT